MAHPTNKLIDLSRVAAIVVAIVAVTGCAGLSGYRGSTADVLHVIEVSAKRKEVPESIRLVLGRPDDLWGKIAWGLEWQHDDALVEAERAKILAQPGFFDVLSERAFPALPWIISEIERRELPMELALVPVIESMLDPWAYSRQRAAGLWQITPATAAHYGLEINWWYDARLDIPVATDFALNYLMELYQRFENDWELALAAYNGGRGRVSRAQNKARTAGKAADYWHLEIPRETRRYVPRILAIADILRHPERFGISLPVVAGVAPMLLVDTNGQIELQRAAGLAGLQEGELRRMNPAQLRWATAPDSPDQLWVPATHAEQLEQGLTRLPSEDRVRWVHYTIASGDSLIAIARRFDTRVQLIRTVNALSGNLIRAGDTLMIPKGDNSQTSLKLAQTDWPPRRKRTGRLHHQVKSGDSLWTIAQRYGLGVEQLSQMNQLDPQGYLQPGQRLRITP